MAHAICSIENCDKPARKVGLCHAHYRRSRLGQSMYTPVRSWGSSDPCTIAGCDKLQKSMGMCPAHYRRHRLGEPMDTPLRRREPGRTCQVDGCQRPYRASGFCGMHWQRMSTHGLVGAAAPLLAPAGSGYINPDGYRVFRINGTTVQEHRLIMEGILGRPLEPFETVHHKNGRRADNSPGNLELWVVPQPYGQRPEDLVAWVVEHYPDLVAAALAARKE